ncbi:MAG: DNA topoisomerase IB [Gemmatimonadales bacterium]|nr:DNA topoisomerase IB [Gemmatimonadales bacterium]
MVTRRGKPPQAIGESFDVPQRKIQSAKAIGLRYVSDSEPGIRRERNGTGFQYLDPEGGPVQDEAELERVCSLVLPPAWTDVWICATPDGHIQATARDAKGRKQYRYHPRYRAFRDETKFTRMLEFSHHLPRIRRHVERDIRREGLTREKVLATMVWLLERTLFRIGNDQYARENKSFGLTTLRRRHVDVAGSEVRFEFRGKSGVKHAAAITDKRIARIVQRCHTLPGEELFQYLDEDGKRQTVDSGDINQYLQQASGAEELTAKDFRTWAGTMLAARALRDVGVAASQREAKTNIVKVVDQVATRLGNTRAVCRKYYVHPAILERYLAGQVIPPSPPSSTPREARRKAELRADEEAVLRLIKNED